MAAAPPESEHEFRQWLQRHATEALETAGVQRGHIILDYGCGTGAFSLVAARMVGCQGKVYAADVDDRMLERVRQSAKAERLGNVAAARLQDGTPLTRLLPERADLILLYDVLHLVPDKTGLLRELCAVLKPRGRLSVFPMHVGVEEMLHMANEIGCLILVSRQGMVLNFQRRSLLQKRQS